MTVTVSVVVRTPLSAVMVSGVGGGGVGDGLALQVGGVGERPVAGSMVTAAPPALVAGAAVGQRASGGVGERSRCR